MRKISRLLFASMLAITVGCAKRGNITGGAKDTIAPVLKASFPKNFSTGFTGNEIKLEFDEYVTLKDANKQLIVSPPMKQAPEISPLTATKTITIKFRDTLLPNTTYSFNFGQSIRDNNEGNPYPQFKYVFSTGSFIDSLSLSGTIKDAHDKKVDSFVSVMLYEANEQFNDSVIFKESPRYITNTLDSAKTFRLENLKAGKYLLIALKDKSSNNRFDPKTDKIGFNRKFVTIPNDTLYEIKLFKEIIPFKAQKPTLASGNKLLMAYEGDPAGLKSELRNGTAVIPTVLTKVPQKDSLHIWYQPVKADSLELSVTKNKISQQFTVKIKPQKKDTLGFSLRQTNILPLREKLTLNATRPLAKIDESLLKITNKDSAAVAFTTDYDEFNMQLKFNFPVEPLQKYKITALPGALVDFFGKANDSLSFSIGTKNTSDYGNLRVRMENVRRWPVIVELTNAKGEVVASEFSENSDVIDFNSLEPTVYTLRLIYDDNSNKVWDTGNYLEKRQGEEVIYFPKDVDVRANWDVDQPFNLP